MMNASMATMEDKRHQVAAMRAKRLSFKKRKACIKKKTMELSVLCGVDACAVIVDGDGEVETWPEKQSAVLTLISRYNNSLCAGNKKMMVYENIEKNLSSDHGWEWDDSLFNGISTESLEDLLKDCVCDADQNQNKVLNVHSWDDRFIDGLPVESLQEVLKEVDSKLEAVVKRIQVLKTVDDQNNNSGKEIVVFNEASEQNIQTPNSFSAAMCLFEGGSNQQIPQSPSFGGWFGDGSSSHVNNILGPSDLDVAENNNQRTQSFEGSPVPEQGFFNMLCGDQTIQTPWVSAEELEYQSLFNIYSHQCSTRRLSFFEESEFPEQSTFGIEQNWKGNQF